MSLRIGAKLPHSGPLPARLGIGEMAATLERAGFDSLWGSDHVVMPTEISSPYPFAADGKATWSTETPWYDVVVALSIMAVTTSRAELNVAVMVLPLRHPVVLAKQLATISVISGGRVGLGVGAGWLREEFDALNVPFESRGRRMDEWIELLRACWSGRPPEFAGEHYRLPAGVICEPVPPSEPPVLIGGTSRAALRRAGRVAQGWVAHQSALALDIDEIVAGVAEMRSAAAAAGRDPEGLRTVLRLVDSADRPGEVAAALPALAAAGVTEVVVDVSWDDPDGPARAHDELRAAGA